MLWSLKHVQARYRMLHYNNRLTWLITILFCAAPVWQACRCLLLLLVFLLRSHPDQYYHHWQRTITASQFWVCHSLLVTGDNGAFSVACELLTESSLCCLVVVREDDQSVSWRGCRLFRKQLWWLPSMRKNLLDAAKVLTGFPALASPALSCSRCLSKRSQVFIGSSSIR